MYKLLSLLFLAISVSAWSAESSKKQSSNDKLRIDSLLHWSKKNKITNRTQAKDYLKQALTLCQTLNIPKKEAEVLKQLGLVYYYDDSFAVATNFYDQAILLSRRIGDSVQVANCLFNKGKIYRDTQQWEVALQNAFQVLQLDKYTKNDKGLAYTFNYIGLLYTSLQDTAKAKNFFLKSLKIREALNHQDGIGYTCLNLGNIAFELKKYDSAEFYYSRSAKIFKKISDPLNYAKAIHNLSNINIQNDRLNEAEKLSNQALEIKLANDAPGVDLAESYIGLGKIAARKQKYLLSDSLYKKALEVALPQDDLTRIVIIYHQLMQNARETDSLNAALAYQQRYFEMREKLFDHERLRKFQALESEFQLMKSKEEVDKLKNEKQLIEENAQLTMLVTGAIILLLLLVLGTIFYILRLKSKHVKELNQKNLELKQINQSLDQFVSIASHDLKAPIASCRGIIDIIKEQSDLQTINEFLQLQEQSLNKLEFLIRDLLDFTRSNRAEVKITKIDLSDKIEEIQHNLKYQKSARKVDLSFDIMNDYEFCSDDIRIRIILNNLVSNSIRYKSITAAKPYVKISVRVNNDKVLLIVKDNGQGIPEEHHDRVFDMFYKVSKNHKSTGLGLYIVQEAVTKLNGKVWFESEVNSGSTFFVELPNHADSCSKVNTPGELTEIS